MNHMEQMAEMADKLKSPTYNEMIELALKRWEGLKSGMLASLQTHATNPTMSNKGSIS